ncbi:TPA: class C sortase, partial [Enterococcus faecalis]|nr:class C sortase [Enterococcus faecalis]
MDQRLKNERINLILKLLMAILFTTGAIICSYPFLANAVNSYYDQKMMEKNLAEMAATNTKEQAKRHQEMAEKNKELAESKNMTNIPGMGLVEDPFENAVDDAKDPGEA